MVNEMLPELQHSSDIIYENGQRLNEDQHFMDHIEHEVPIQVYLGAEHYDIGFVEWFSRHHVRINDVEYDRSRFTFISRPGY